METTGITLPVKTSRQVTPEPGELQARTAALYSPISRFLRMNEAGVLDWLKGRPLFAVNALYQRARKLRLAREEGPDTGLAKLAAAVADPALVRRAVPKARVKVDSGKDLVGVRYPRDRSDVVGLRQGGACGPVGREM